MIYHQKKLSNNFEKALVKIISLNGLKVLNNSNFGIDLYIRELNLFIEVKSSFTYSKYKCNYRKQIVRFSHYSFKPNELLGLQKYYIFIEKINKINNLNFIKSLNIFVIKTSDIKKYMVSQYKDLTKRIQISVNRIRNLSKCNLNDFIEILKNG